MDRLTLIKEFEEKTGMSFFSANQHFFWDMPDEIRSEVMLSEEDVNITSDENFKMVYDYLFPLAIWKEKARKSIDAKKINSFFKDSISRCNWFKRRDTTSTDWLIGKAFINEWIIKNVLLRNQAICFNPLYQINWWWKSVPLIFQPSQKLLNRLKFITAEYKWTHLKWYNADLKYMKSFEHLNIQENDIINLYLWMYHPYVRWLIQTEQFSLLNHT